MKAVVLHQNGNVNGNILWPRPLTDEERESLIAACSALRKEGYWVSPFPEGDGVTFRKEPYGSAGVFAELQAAFSFLELQEAEYGRDASEKLAQMAKGEFSDVVCLIPVSALKLDANIIAGNTIFHAPVDGECIKLSDHQWGLKLCDIPGADVDDGWAPDKVDCIENDADLLAYPLIERRISLPLDLYYEASASIQGQERLVEYVISEADRALDILRWHFCSYKRLEYLPNRAGWIGDFAYAYLDSNFGERKPKLFGVKPSVLRVENNWLGLEVDSNQAQIGFEDIALLIDDTWPSDLLGEVKSALRAYGQSFYLVEPEASFLSMIYAIDALAAVGKLTGPRQRVWVAAAAAPKNERLFSDILNQYDDLYSARNRLVHGGERFASLSIEWRKANQSIGRILALIITHLIQEGYGSRAEYVGAMSRILRLPKYEVVIGEKYPNKIKLPISSDEKFSQIIQKGSTNI